MTSSPQVLSKGANVQITSPQVLAVLSWTVRPGVPDVDASALLLGADGRVRSDADFVFYNQPQHPGGAVAHRGKSESGPWRHDAVWVDLTAMDAGVDRVVLGASADGGPFGAVPNLVVRLFTPANDEVASYPVEGATTETAFLSGELYRRGGAWRFRAIGQGYESGLRGLATDFGISVDEPAPTPAPPPAAPVNQLPGVRPVPGEERLPLDLRKALTLRKQQVALTLAKHGGAGLTARVVLVLDASGSMAFMYARGTVAKVVERMAAVAAQLDDNGEMQAFTFASNPAQLPDLRIGELSEWITLHVRRGGDKVRNPRPGQVDMRGVGIQNEEQKVIAMVRGYVRANPSPHPTLVLFYSDGGVYRNREIEEQLRAAVREPIFWQFVGLGKSGFGVLERFDTLPGREIDNVGFFAVPDITKTSDEELYHQLLSEFPKWVSAARALGVLR